MSEAVKDDPTARYLWRYKKLQEANKKAKKMITMGKIPRPMQKVLAQIKMLGNQKLLRARNKQIKRRRQTADLGLRSDEK
jgi:hypothetical protein